MANFFSKFINVRDCTDIHCLISKCWVNCEWSILPMFVHFHFSKGGIFNTCTHVWNFFFFETLQKLQSHV